MTDETEVEIKKSETYYESDFVKIYWQDKTVKEAGGKNGDSVEEVLLACVLRLRQLNDQLPCQETNAAIANIENGLGNLYRRTKLREEQDVEGSEKAHKS